MNRDPSKYQHGYEVVPYRSLSLESTHPGRAFTVANIFQVEPAPIEEARILELGCASGGNQIPIVIDLPKSTCLGVDFFRKLTSTLRKTSSRN